MHTKPLALIDNKYIVNWGYSSCGAIQVTIQNILRIGVDRPKQPHVHSHTWCILNISPLNALKCTGVLTLQWSCPVFLVVSTAIGMLLGVKQGILSCLTLQDISNEVCLQIVARRVLSVLANGRHIKLPQNMKAWGHFTYRCV